MMVVETGSSVLTSLTSFGDYSDCYGCVVVVVVDDNVVVVVVVVVDIDVNVYS